MSERPSTGSEAAFEAVATAFGGDPRVTHGRRFGSADVLSVNGKIFAMLAKGSLVLKLPKARVDELVEAGRGQRFDPGHGRIMKEWVAIGLPQRDWVALAKEARVFVSIASGGR